ncbi:MAG: hypothetical protein ABSH51_15640 [Solirubrobacteraceae bacterium]
MPQPPAAGDGAAADGNPPPPAPSAGSATDQLVTLAATLASGVGLLGFVTFAGGVVMWKRFREMGVPADLAVSELPKSLLITTGAEFLVPALLITLVVVVLLVGMRTLREGRRRWKADGAAIPVAFGRVRRLNRKAKDLWWTVVWVPSRSAVLGLIVAAFEVLWAWLSSFPGLHLGASLVLSGVAIAGGTAIAVALHQRKSTPTVALVAFAAVGTFWIARAYDIISYAPTVLPMAYSRLQSGKPPRVEAGFLVAETSDRIWYASLPRPGPGNPNELREFPRTETEDLEVGQLAPPAVAESRAQRFLGNLCDRLLATLQHPTGCGAATVRTRRPAARRGAGRASSARGARRPAAAGGNSRG